MSANNAMDAERMVVALAPLAAETRLSAPFDIGMAMYRCWLGATSRALQDQVAHLQNLAECVDPLNMLVYQTEYAEKSLTAGFDELRRGIGTLADTTSRRRPVDGTLSQ